MIRRILSRVWRWITGHPRSACSPPIVLTYIEGDELPAEIPERTLLVAREDGDLWSAGMTCPCGCGRRIELMLLSAVKPRWDLEVDEQGLPTLRPSVWVNDGCRSHFWLRAGKVDWCSN